MKTKNELLIRGTSPEIVEFISLVAKGEGLNRSATLANVEIEVRAIVVKE